MLLTLNADQELFRETTAKFLADGASVDEIRGLRDDLAGFTASYWADGAGLGWTSLLVDEAHGGGSISDHGLVDLTVVAHEFGRHAAPGPLVDCNVVASALSAAGAGAHAEVLDGLLSGTYVATWCIEEPPPHSRFGEVTTTIELDGADVVINGVNRPVESAERADYFLVAGQTDGGLTQVLLPRDTPGLSVAPLHSIDVTRRFGQVTFRNVRVPAAALVGEAGRADDQVALQLRLAAVILTAEAVGAMQAAFDMTVAWAFDRYSFGRPLASYQALKHRFADMKSWLEAGHAISDAAAAAVAGDTPDAAELVSAAKAFVGDYGAELAQECVQLHGGIGVTYEHDLHLFLRRITLNRTLAGTPADHRQRLASIAENREDVA